jgi:uncharacterized pyridoxamine 5'-phosphate oxidase family protein
VWCQAHLRFGLATVWGGHPLVVPRTVLLESIDKLRLINAKPVYTDIV